METAEVQYFFNTAILYCAHMRTTYSRYVCTVLNPAILFCAHMETKEVQYLTLYCTLRTWELLKYSMNPNSTGVWEVRKLPGPFSLDLAFTRCKITSAGIWQMLRERCSFGNPPRMLQQHWYTQKERDSAHNREPAPPPALYAAWDQKLIGMLTGAALHCGPGPGRTSLMLKWSVIAVKPDRSGGVRRSASRLNLWQKKKKIDVETSFFEVTTEVQKDLEDVSAGIGQFLKNSDIWEVCPEFDVKVGKVNFDLTL